MSRRPGTPRLLRQLNDRAALELLLSVGPLTRSELGERTGLSKVTAGQLLARLQERGLVTVVGEQAGGRGPNAALYAVVPSCAYVAGLDVLPDRIAAGVADITGEIVAEVAVDPSGHDDPVRLVRSAVRKACASAGIGADRLRAFVIGTRGVVDPGTGDVRFSFDLPSWHAGVLAQLRRDLDIPVTIENDVNLAALAERAHGAARDADDFVLLWAGVGQGLGVMLGGRLHRGATGGAGEIGWLPVPGEPLPTQVNEPQSGSFQRLVGGDAVTGLAHAHGIVPALAAAPAPAGGLSAPALAAGSGSVGDYVRMAVDGGADAFLEELAGRLAVGVAAVAVVLDPGLIVLSGDVGRAGGEALAVRVEEAVARVCPSRPSVVITEVRGNPVLRGALVSALQQAREQVFSDTV
ncbi:putative NBD/HSP70 family sugar kinase [Streptosporangium becharense]|uniref:Putative NBD/HSP70 family sugar kinase n=1 Tax=Streptosporangium becharense TaxID=1816182 RepID=A0A7W9IE12_9ACTN|nr:ROK family protein [Streptosporangium becharense]MBB2912229.1 putative NBD/HSP70 family sugar kinase [Streptosporangium becharense]MBB5818776.1 putative NBD/HSP70 family sugar kinase [Streptosporangium becharense]